MKHSIKKQMTGIFIALIVCMLLSILVINIGFLEPYYIDNKQNAFVNMYASLATSVKSREITTDEGKIELSKQAEQGNISYVVISTDGDSWYTNVLNNEMLRQQLTGYLLNQIQKNSKVLERTDEYQMNQSLDPVNNTEYLEMWGNLEGGYTFLLRSPLESIKESASLSNQFLVYIGLIIISIGSVLVWFFSKRLTDPILELTALSAKMAELDFDAKYKSGGENEIGVLGGNFNTMSERLETAISDLKSANYHLRKDIEQKEKLEEMRNDFLGNVSHELKTPIALIQGYAEGLKEGIDKDAKSREFYCDVIMDEAVKMNEMVKNLLNLNQLEFGKEEIEFVRFDIVELIKGVLQSMDIMIQQKEALITFRQETSVYVWADEFKGEQVLRNYISNALHHLAGERVVEIKIEEKENKARISVFNTGIPIPEEDVGHIWEKFYKVDKAHTREYGGNGIGLSIVKAIMESFHQEYGVQNYDNGVAFWFELDMR